MAGITARVPTELHPGSARYSLAEMHFWKAAVTYDCQGILILQGLGEVGAGCCNVLLAW